MRSSARAALLLTVWVAAAGAATPPPFSETELDAAIETLRHDSNLVQQEKTTRALRWKSSASKPRRPVNSSGWMVNFLEWLTGSARAVIWILGGLAAAVAVPWVLRLLKARVPGVRAVLPPAPVSHVQNLDVRPASLPADIGAAAAALLAAGQVREALSLLYRGALSRAIHRHGIPIAASSTEGEVLAQVTPRLTAPGAAYVAQLVALWQRAVYAAEPPPGERVAALCREFAVLDGAPA